MIIQNARKNEWCKFDNGKAIKSQGGVWGECSWLSPNWNQFIKVRQDLCPHALTNFIAQLSHSSIYNMTHGGGSYIKRLISFFTNNKIKCGFCKLLFDLYLYSYRYSI